MTQEKYIQMCNTMGDEIDPAKLPPEYSSFPNYVHLAIDVFNCLPDRFSGGMSSVYSGKDLASLDILYNLFMVSEHQKLLVFGVITFLDGRARDRALKEAKKASKRGK